MGQLDLNRLRFELGDRALHGWNLKNFYQKVSNPTWIEEVYQLALCNFLENRDFAIEPVLAWLKENRKDIDKQLWLDLYYAAGKLTRNDNIDYLYDALSRFKAKDLMELTKLWGWKEIYVPKYILDLLK